MRSLITGMEITKRDVPQDYNSLTGMYSDVPEDDDIEKGGSKWPSISKRDDDAEDGDEEGDEFNKFVPMIAAIEKGDEHIVYGIVYEPDTVDAQGDKASAEEIKKAAYDFMEHAQSFKVMHKGKSVDIKVLESYVAPQKLTVAGKTIKKGTWVLAARINDAKIWKAVKAGKLKGFSMAGYAKVS